MAKRVFFSFHYQDVIDFRANVVRNHWITQDREDAGFYDASIWESAKKQGSIALKRLINKGLSNTSNTCLLIGSGTYLRPWVRYEIFKSMKKGNHIFGVHINGIKCKNSKAKNLGYNPFDYLGYKISEDGRKLTMYEIKNSKWVLYSEIDGSDTYALDTQASVGRRGKFYKLSSDYKVYKWYKDDGYKNFNSWTR